MTPTKLIQALKDLEEGSKTWRSMEGPLGVSVQSQLLLAWTLLIVASSSDREINDALVAAEDVHDVQDHDEPAEASACPTCGPDWRTMALGELVDQLFQLEEAGLLKAVEGSPLERLSRARREAELALGRP